MFTFFCLTVIRPWLNLPTGCHGHVIYMGNLEGVFSCENTPEGRIETHKSYFSFKQISGRNGNHEWLRMTNAFILCNLQWKVQKSHAVNREGSFNYLQIYPYICKRFTMSTGKSNIVSLKIVSSVEKKLNFKRFKNSIWKMMLSVSRRGG